MYLFFNAFKFQTHKKIDSFLISHFDCNISSFLPILQNSPLKERLGNIGTVGFVK